MDNTKPKEAAEPTREEWQAEDEACTAWLKGAPSPLVPWAIWRAACKWATPRTEAAAVAPDAKPDFFDLADALHTGRRDAYDTLVEVYELGKADRWSKPATPSTDAVAEVVEADGELHPRWIDECRSVCTAGTKLYTRTEAAAVAPDAWRWEEPDMLGLQVVSNYPPTQDAVDIAPLYRHPAAPSNVREDTKLVERAVRNAKHRSYSKWAAVQEVFGHGSTLSREICERFGFDPDASAETAKSSLPWFDALKLATPDAGKVRFLEPDEFDENGKPIGKGEPT